MTAVAQHLIMIDSADRDFVKYASESEYTISLPTTYKDVVRAALVSAEIPSTYDTVCAARGNSSLVMSVGASAATTVTVPDGRYATVDALVAALQTALNAAFSPVTFTATATAPAATVGPRSPTARRRP